MNNPMNPARQYRTLNAQTAVADASPHELIDLLFKGARDRVNQAKGYMTREDWENTSAAINACVDIVSALQASLDFEQGGEIAANLESLYDYIQRRLFRANTDRAAGALDEVADLIDTLRSAWTAISPDQQMSAG